MVFGCCNFCACLELFTCFLKILKCFFVGEERLIPYLLVVRSSSSDCIGLFRFVMVIVPDCCKSSNCFHTSVRRCSTVCLSLKIFRCCMSFDIVRGFFVLFLVVSNCSCLVSGSSCCLIVSSRAVWSFCSSSCFSFVVRLVCVLQVVIGLFRVVLGV